MQAIMARDLSYSHEAILRKSDSASINVLGPTWPDAGLSATADILCSRFPLLYSIQGNLGKMAPSRKQNSNSEPPGQVQLRLPNRQPGAAFPGRGHLEAAEGGPPHPKTTPPPPPARPPNISASPARDNKTLAAPSADSRIAAGNCAHVRGELPPPQESEPRSGPIEEFRSDEIMCNHIIGVSRSSVKWRGSGDADLAARQRT